MFEPKFIFPWVALAPIFIFPVRAPFASVKTPPICDYAKFKSLEVDTESIDDDFNVVIVSVPCAVG